MVNKEIEEFAAKIAQQQDAGIRIKRHRLENQQLKEELEVYRERDRLQEAGQVPLTEQQKLINELKPVMKEEQTIPSLAEIMERRKVDMFEATRIQEAIRLKKDGLKAACITAELRKHRPQINWEGKYNKEHKLRQEAETETILVKGIGMNSPEMKKAQARIKELEEALANALAIDDSHQKLNGKLQVRIAELEDDNKKISKQIEDQLERARRAGL